MVFHDRLLFLLNKNKITKTQFLHDLNLSKNAICTWQDRGTIPSGDTLIRIADYFDVSVDYLLGHDRTNDTVALIENCTPEELRQALAIVQALKEAGKEKK